LTGAVFPVLLEAVSMRAFLSELDVYRWAGRMLIDSGRVRRKDRLSWRFASTAGPAE
jgi:hypothetical protein